MAASRHAWLGAGLLFGAPHLAAAESPPFVAFASGPGQVIVSHEGQDHLTFGLAAWGPQWAWTGIEGRMASEGGAAVGALSARLGGATARLDFRAARTAPNTLELSYELKAETDTDLTLFVVELAPGKAFEGREVTVESPSGQTTVRCPFGRRAIGERVSALRLTGSVGALTRLSLEPPGEIAADGAARIILAKDRLKVAAPRRLTLRLELPGETAWFASAAEVPEEPGLEAWYPWQASGDTGESVLGLQDWLERPAGRHGRIRRQGDQLVYHGRPIKLWGLNLCYGTCAPEKGLADRRAAFYRKYGINAVRLHKFADNAGWGGIQSKDSGVEYDPAGLDRMDYQVARFKDAGIYVKLSAHFGTLKLGPADRAQAPFLEEFGRFRDGRIETPHSAIHYSPELQEAHIRQMVNLLKHRNPHTGLTYAEDPAVACIEIINEQSILFFTSMAPLKASATLRRQVGARFCAWLRKKYGGQDRLAQAWGPAAFNCFTGDGFPNPGESLDRGDLLPLGNPWYWDPAQLQGSQAPKKRRLLDTLEFLYTLECEFYDRYVEALRQAGYEGEVLASNWQAGRAFSHFANLHADYRVGMIDRHNYFGGQRANASMLARAGSGTLSSGLQQAADRPFMLSEWIHVFPSELGLEGPAIIGAYGLGLQGWDASFLFQNGDSGGFSDRIGRDTWDATAPQILGLFPAVSRQVHRGDVREAAPVGVRNVHVPSLFEGQLGFEDTVAQGYDDKELDSRQVPARALAVGRSVVAFTDQFRPTPPFDLAPFQKNEELVSSTGQLRWREARGQEGGSFTLDTPGTQAVVGFAAGRRCELGEVILEPASRFAAIYVTAREPDKTLANSRELLVVALARARNTGMKFSPAGDRLLARGSAPVLLEPVRARLTLRRPGQPSVFALDHDGRLTPRAVPVEQGVIQLDGARDRTPYYVVRY